MRSAFGLLFLVLFSGSVEDNDKIGIIVVAATAEVRQIIVPDHERQLGVMPIAADETLVVIDRYADISDAVEQSLGLRPPVHHSLATLERSIGGRL